MRGAREIAAEIYLDMVRCLADDHATECTWCQSQANVVTAARLEVTAALRELAEIRAKSTDLEERVYSPPALRGAADALEVMIRKAGAE